MTTSQVGCTLKDETVMGSGGLVGKKRKKTNGQGNPSCIKRVRAPSTILFRTAVGS